MIPDLIHIDPASIPSVLGEIPIRPIEPGLFPSIEIKIDFDTLLTSRDDIQCVAIVPNHGEKYGNQKTKRKKEKRT